MRSAADAESNRDRLIALLVVVIPALALAAYIYLLKHDTPIWGDGARVINERLPPTLRSLLKSDRPIIRLGHMPSPRVRMQIVDQVPATDDQNPFVAQGREPPA